MNEKDRKNSCNESFSVEKIRLDTGAQCEIFLPEFARDRFKFENENCEYIPVGWSRIDGIWYPLGYKVVTENLQSLGLRNNPNIMTFPIGVWVNLPEEQTKTGKVDWGGIWVAQRKSSIKTLKEHCKNTWGMETRGFLTAVNNPLFANSYRIKSQGVMLLKEII